MEWPERVIAGVILLFCGTLMILATQNAFVGFVGGWILIALGAMVGSGLYHWLERKREERLEQKGKK